MRKFNKRVGNVVLACATVGALAVAGVGSFSAYLTDNAQTTNTFTVGKVQINLEEPSYPGNDSNEVTNIVPNQEIAKDPQVENTGKNEAIVYISVSIPIKKLAVAGADGTRKDEAITQLFQTSADGGTTYTDNAFNADWTWIKTVYTNSDGTETIYTDNDNHDIPEDAIKVTRIYGYNNKLATTGDEAKTSAIFDKVKLVNVIEGYVDATTQDIEIKTCAIQSDNITDVDTSTLDQATLTSIYNVYMNQNKTNAN